MTGTEWNVDVVNRVVDGDTVHVTRSRDAQLGDTWFTITDTTPKSVRLVWVNTPERGQPGYQLARQHLERWCITHAIGLRVICYESAGWDRILGDLVDADGNSASQWLMVEKGWPPYTGGKA